MSIVATTDRLLTRAEAAEFLHTTPGTLAVWACTRRHALPYIKLGRAVRYRLSDLEAYLDRQTVNPVPATV